MSWKPILFCLVYPLLIVMAFILALSKRWQFVPYQLKVDYILIAVIAIWLVILFYFACCWFLL